MTQKELDQLEEDINLFLDTTDEILACACSDHDVFLLADLNHILYTLVENTMEVKNA